jgi:hypothetical protein
LDLVLGYVLEEVLIPGGIPGWRATMVATPAVGVFFLEHSCRILPGRYNYNIALQIIQYIHANKYI